MKKFFFSLIALSLVLDLFSQNPNYKNGISFKTLFLDYQSQQNGRLEAFKDYHHGFEIAYKRNLNNGLSLNFPFKAGVVQVYDSLSKNVNDCLHKRVGSIDGQIHYNFYSNTNQIVPYLLAGIGGVMEYDGKFNAQVPFGLGVNFKAADNAFINIQSEYRFSFLEDRNNLQHSLGFVYLFGGKADQDSIQTEPKDAMEEEAKLKAEKEKLEKERQEEMKAAEMQKEEARKKEEMEKQKMEKEKIEKEKEKMEKEKAMKEKKKDADGDGIEDYLDLCPDAAGSIALNGCPDTDKDGVADFQDSCPNIAGDKMMKGCPDSDNDGVSDNDDQCPNLAGPKTNNGCPIPKTDRDGDGINDDLDRCPDLAGTIENNGCPVADRDNDGIPDASDRCPDMSGNSNLNGCPDKDNDGVADPDDKCPNAHGLKVYGGCPDTDGDGLDDSIDRCPNTPGTVASKGCPDIAVEDKKTLDIAMRAVQFETGKAILKGESYAILRQISGILNRYPDYNLSISGHTDNTGSSVANQELSEKRARACYDYLITQNIDAYRLSHAGYGESRPIADNASENGRALNRRVEFNLNPR